ncbi:MAG: [FeFe] hydrogenase H-cluster radical SAM maturase HydE [Bacteroidota bacterium]
MNIDEILNKEEFSRADIIYLLSLSNQEEKDKLAAKAYEVKKQYIGNIVYFRGLIEYSNICDKDCLYCGIRKENDKVDRYVVSDEEVLEAAKFAYENKYGSIVIQSGELETENFINKIDNLIKKIKELSNGELGITLSCGEQTEEVYKRWFESGAHRYLLRIESSNKRLYEIIHPIDPLHNFERRLDCLKSLRRVGFQVGTGVMIGLPFQSVGDLADDLLFLKAMDVDMVGMGPYIEHEDTPLYQFKDKLMPKTERLNLALRMIAVLRIMMKDINIASATALQAIDGVGREKGIKLGANIIMPNLTPTKYREGYQLYEDKPCMDEEAADCMNCLEARIHLAGDKIGYGEWGDSKHFDGRK